MGEEDDREFTRRKTDRYEAEQKAALARKRVHVRTLYIVAVAISAVLVFVALATVEQILHADENQEQAHSQYLECSTASANLQIASDFLTAQARIFAVTGEREYLDGYLEEIQVTDRRGAAVETLRSHLYDANDSIALGELEEALRYSNELAERELYAMALAADAIALDPVPELIAAVELKPEDLQLSNEEKLKLAEKMLFDDTYRSYKAVITEKVNSCSDDLTVGLIAKQQANEELLHNLLFALRVMVFLLVVMVLFVILTTAFLVLRPMAQYIRSIRQGDPLPLHGAYELHYLAEAYNHMYEENHQRTMRLQHAAEHDPLTGLSNRGVYDSLIAEHEKNVALLLIDVDKFKEFNDEFGHDTGDAVLKKVADTIAGTFRLTDFPCRIGGDEFAVIMTDMDSSLRDVVAAKIEHIAEVLRDTSDGVPEITLSVGVAFSGEHPEELDLYRAADTALYKAKGRGRNGYAFYGEE